MYDTHGFLDNDRFQCLMQPLVDQVLYPVHACMHAYMITLCDLYSLTEAKVVYLIETVMQTLPPDTVNLTILLIKLFFAVSVIRLKTR